MDVVHAAEMPWGESLVAHRAGGEVAHKRLFEGVEGSPDNYMLVMSKEPNSYFSPRHRHPWDQIRFCLEGRIPIAKGLFVEGGEIAYFPESAHYGPQEGGDDRIVVLLQFGGASGQGFIGVDRLNQARRDLANDTALICLGPRVRDREVHTIRVGFDERYTVRRQRPADEVERLPAATRHLIGRVHVREPREVPTCREITIGGVDHDLHRGRHRLVRVPLGRSRRRRARVRLRFESAFDQPVHEREERTELVACRPNSIGAHE